MAEISTENLPTAEEDPESWNILWVANRPVPGICLPIEGERKRDVEHKKSKGSTRDILVDQGLEPTECTVTIRTNDATTFRSLYDFYVQYMSPDRPLSRQNVVPVYHPQLYARGIAQGYFYDSPLPKPTENGGIRPYLHVFKFKIVGPKTQIGDATSKSKKPTVSSNTIIRDGLNKYFELSEAVTNSIKPAFFWLTNDEKPRPPAQGQAIYNPALISKIAQSGDPTAEFIQSIWRNSTP